MTPEVSGWLKIFELWTIWRCWGRAIGSGNVAHSQITLTAQLTGNIGIPRIARITITVLLRYYGYYGDSALNRFIA
jgi:hypothetical protein